MNFGWVKMGQSALKTRAILLILVSGGTRTFKKKFYVIKPESQLVYININSTFHSYLWKVKKEKDLRQHTPPRIQLL